MFVFDLLTTTPNRCFEAGPNHGNEKVPTGNPTYGTCKYDAVAAKTRMLKVAARRGALVGRADKPDSGVARSCSRVETPSKLHGFPLSPLSLFHCQLLFFFFFSCFVKALKVLCASLSVRQPTTARGRNIPKQNEDDNTVRGLREREK